MEGDMRRRRFITSMAAIGLAAALSACGLMSKNPVGPQSAAIEDAQLAGDWRHESSEGDIIFLHIFSGDDSDAKGLQLLYTATKLNKGTWFALKGYVTTTPGEHRFLNLQLVGAPPEAMKGIDEGYPDRADYPYSFMPYRLVDADHLMINGPPVTLVQGAIKDGRLAGTIGGSDSFPVAKVTDTSENIAAVLGAESEETLFKEAIVFTRVKPTP
jgi:hypothetical protein